MNSPNVARLETLCAIIRNPEAIRKHFDASYDLLRHPHMPAFTSGKRGRIN